MLTVILLLLYVLDRGFNLPVVVVTAELQHTDASCRPGITGTVRIRHVLVATGAGIVAIGDVLEGTLDGLVGDMHAAVLGSAESHHLHDGVWTKCSSSNGLRTSWENSLLPLWLYITWAQKG